MDRGALNVPQRPQLARLLDDRRICRNFFGRRRPKVGGNLGHQQRDVIEEFLGREDPVRLDLENLGQSGKPLRRDDEPFGVNGIRDDLRV